MENNYEKQVLISRKLFMEYDQNQMIKKFNLEHDDQYLYLTYQNDRYRISRSDGSIERRMCTGTAYFSCMEYNTVMTIYDIFCCSDDAPILSGQWCPVASLMVTHSSPSTNTFTDKSAAAFSGHIPDLKRACRSMGGEQLSVPASADVCFRIPVFPFFPVIFQFWDEDDEFPPKIMVLFDTHTLKFLHFETVYYVLINLIHRLEMICGSYNELERQLIDTIKEWQIKIGYQKGHMRLYYPADSLKRMLKLPQDTSIRGLDAALQTFSETTAERLGRINISSKEGRYCLDISEKGCEYIADQIPEPEFLKQFLHTITFPGNTLAQVRSCFSRAASEAGVTYLEKDEEHGGLGHVFYFPDGDPDEYVYCVEEDDFGLTYHRFTREDYDLGFDHE